MSDKANKPIVMEMNKFVATMVANNSQIERTGKPMSDEEFMGMYEALPNNIRIEVSSDVLENQRTVTSKRDVAALLGGASGKRTSRSRSMNGDDYDEVSVLLTLDTPGKVRAFRKSPMFHCEGKVVTEEEFGTPEGRHKSRGVYQQILEREGVYGVYSETRPVTIPNIPMAKTAKPKMHKKRYDEAQEGDRAVSLETVVPIECCSLFQPSKAGVSNFISRRQKREMDNFIEFMEETSQSDKPRTLIYLAGLFDLITDDEVDTMMNIIDTNSLAQDTETVYHHVLSALLTDMTDNKVPITVRANNFGEIDIASAVMEVISNNQSLKAIYESGLNILQKDKYLRVLMEDEPNRALASILSGYMPMSMPELVDMGAAENLELIFNLMQLSGGHVSNEQVTLTVKECDVVTFGNN